MSIFNEIIDKIEANKEILETFPKNNEKNINIYLKKLEDLINEHTKFEDVLVQEMKKRYNTALNIETDEETIALRNKIDSNEGVLYLLNKIDTSYEKMDLDKAIHNLNFFYKRDLEIVNENILYCIKKFKEVGIEIKSEDIAYSKYVKEYLTMFFGEMENGDINSKRIKTEFERIYWQCPDIIIYIELNIRYLYLKYEREIDKYYEKQKYKLLKNFSDENLFERYQNLKMEFINQEKNDKNAIIKKFIDGTLFAKDYTKTAIDAKYLKFIDKEDMQILDEMKLNEIDTNLKKLNNSLYEYKNYLKYKFIIDDIKQIYAKKEEYKNIYLQTRKEIENHEKKILKIEKEINGTGFLKKASDKNLGEQNKLILELHEMYKKLDLNKVYNKVAVELNDNSTISDALYLASSFYTYLFNCIKENYKELAENEIDDFIAELREFVKWPYYTIINNIKLQEEKDILVIIKDRYQLLKINITKDDLAEENLDILMSIIDSILINNNIRKNNINIEELDTIREIGKTLEKNSII